MKRYLAVFLLFLTSLSATFAKNADSFIVENQEISQIAKMLAELTGKNLVIDQRVRGKFSIYIRGKLSPDELWNIFTLGLNQIGFTVRFDNKTQTVQILPIITAKQVPFTTNGTFAGQMVLGLINLNYLSANSAAQAVKPLLSGRGTVSAVGPHLIAVWDFKENVSLVAKVLQRLDTPEAKNTAKVYPLGYISSRSFEQALRALIAGWLAQGKPRVYYARLPDGNAVVVVGPEAFQKKVEELQRELDNLGKERNPSFYVIPLNFISVDEVQKALGKLFSTSAGQGSINLPTGLRISFDKSSNAVLVFGTKTQYEILKRLISELDRRKKQVLITATVVEASLQNILDAGVNWQILGTHGGVAFGALSREGLYQALSQGQFVIGALSKSGTAVSVGGSTVFFPDLLFLYSLLERGQGFNIISNPKVLTLDNQKATIKVGQQVPFPTGIKYDVNGNPIITYDYRYVGLELDVTPRISQKSLRMVINLKLQEITGYINNNVGGINYSVPITSTRELNSDVVVQNGQTIIIGGLIDTKTLESTSKVPLLGDIPVVGNLFKYRHSERQKTNLFIFITPYVISSPRELAKIMEEHKKLALELYKLQKGEKVNDADFKRWLESINAVKPAPVR